MDEIEGLTTRGRETGVRKLMATNLLKRFESSVHSFRVTLKRVYGYMDDTVKVIDKYEQHRAEHKSLGMFDRIDADVFDEGFDLDRDDAEEIEFTTQGKTQFALSDMDWKSWRSYIQADMRVIEGLLAMIRDIDPEHCVCSIESGPCERVDVFHVSGRFWSTSACGEKRTPARPAWTSFPS